MSCAVRYLNSAGIHPREIRGIDALSRAYPKDWLLYASLQAYPRNEPPIEIDALVVMDDRVLILEIKDWNGELTSNGDRWVLNGKPRGRSPVDTVGLKAKKLKTILSSAIPGFSSHYVDSRVVLTGSATKDLLSGSDKAGVWNLEEACSISELNSRKKLLGVRTFSLKKAYTFEPDFERVTRNTRMFGPSEAIWEGYRVVEEDLVVHPRRIWREHRAELVRDLRHKALLRIWEFDKLSPGLNSAETRRLIGERESRAFGLLSALGSTLVESGGLLAPIGQEQEEVLTQHYELRRLPTGWTTLDRYLEKVADEFTADDRLTAVSSLLGILMNLHAADISHRDLGPRSVWVGGPTQMAISGLVSCQMPDETSIAGWLPELRGYSPFDDGSHESTASGKERDVLALGRLSLRLLSRQLVGTDPDPDSDLLDTFAELRPWIKKAMSPKPSDRFDSARSMADAFGSAVEAASSPAIDQLALDRNETELIPYIKWPVSRVLAQNERSQVYISGDSGHVAVKVWMGIRRGSNAATDLAMLRMFDGVRRLINAPLSGLPMFIETGLSPIGPFAVYRFVEGTSLEDSVSPAQGLRRAETLIHAVNYLHANGTFHGDITPANIVLVPPDKITLLDLFDMTPVGNGRVGTDAFRPPNWERLTEQEVDRYAVVKCARLLLGSDPTSISPRLLATIDQELARPAIATLEPLMLSFAAARREMERPVRPLFQIATEAMATDFLTADNGTYYLRVRRISDSFVEYSLSGREFELIFEVSSGELVGLRSNQMSYSSLSHASEHGIPIEIDIEVTRGQDAGFEELFSYVVNLLPPPAKAVRTETESEEADAAPANPLDVRRYWRNLLELEEQFQPQVMILGDGGGRAQHLDIYRYERSGREFDFDIDAQVEIRLPGGRKMGELDLSLTDNRLLFVRPYDNRKLVAGDYVHLHERRTRTSFDRRQKAVERILDNRGAIPDLVEYFAPRHIKSAIDYGVEVTDEELAPYQLNQGQRAAFRRLARFGPLGLQQGPPGTGKTRFIAAFTHWLVTRQDCRSILIASQSHEAVNNAIEALVDLFKEHGGERPSLLRIGSKGITEKILPFHTRTLRDRYRVRFNTSYKNRVVSLGAAVGLGRAFVTAALEVDQQLGIPARRLLTLARLAEQRVEAPSAEERRRDTEAVRNCVSAFEKAGRALLGREVNAEDPEGELNQAFMALLESHVGVSVGDIGKIRKIIGLADEWSASLASSHRNFEEFLAKTRTIVTATCVGVGQTKIRVDARLYDWVIVDEAARCTPSELAVPIQMGRRVVLVGDHLQLLPMFEKPVLDALEKAMPEASPSDLARSDFERAFGTEYGQKNGMTLTEQYRMVEPICNLVSSVFYEPNNVRLVTSVDRKPDLLFDGDLSGTLKTPITWLDTSKTPNHIEKRPEWSKTSYWNKAEVEAIVGALEEIADNEALVAGLVDSAEPTPIGIICMYSAQKEMVEQAFSRHPWSANFRRLVRIDTVDSYQGKENAIVIVSLVRCNLKGAAGHVRSAHRCNVALSRAKERLIIVGSSEMWAGVAESQPMHRVLQHLRRTTNVASMLHAQVTE